MKVKHECECKCSHITGTVLGWGGVVGERDFRCCTAAQHWSCRLIACASHKGKKPDMFGQRTGECETQSMSTWTLLTASIGVEGGRSKLDAASRQLEHGSNRASIAGITTIYTSALWADKWGTFSQFIKINFEIGLLFTFKVSWQTLVAYKDWVTIECRPKKSHFTVCRSSLLWIFSYNQTKQCWLFCGRLTEF